ncbi:hypothetical protein E3A20_14310 [Planctomyces bekefii]|uniref:phospholipase D n=1 Tax=Planctomyces bekefii TaxID=1653850 RepID=A0A5C6M617_9PLAN|nr:hypothetical protein E3A20_14310 [Planctomyces bekefii]
MLAPMGRAQVLTVALIAFGSAVGCRTTSESSETKDERPLDEVSLESASPSNKFRFIEWDVRFTNPVCQPYPYSPDQPVTAVNGEALTAKPINTFCSSKKDRLPSASRPEAPQSKLIEWINGTQAGDEIFFAYLSFSNNDVYNALCKAVTERSVKINFVLDRTQDLTVANKLKACMAPDGDPAKSPNLIPRGGEPSPGPGQQGIGYAHNKIFMVNPGRNPMKLAFSSGNMSSGIVLHHENWNFVTMEPNTYFAQAHLCLMKAQMDNDATKSRNKYAEYIAACRAKITSEMGLQEEEDVKVYFTPGEGEKARDALVAGIKKSDKVYVAAHRFLYPYLVKNLGCAASRSLNPAEVNIVTDDDTYWVGTTGEQTGDNVATEYSLLQSVIQKGAKVRWMETNHGQHLLHHNKYVVMNKNDGSWGAVFGGAGNFTKAAFGTNDRPNQNCNSDQIIPTNPNTGDSGTNPNFENFYYIEVPAVLQRYNEQFPHMWNDLATPTERMPSRNILPPGAMPN